MSITCGGDVTVFSDLRSQISEVRDQGSRPLCMICAASDVHEAFHTISHALSAEYLAFFCQQHEGVRVFSSGFGPETVSCVMSSKGQPSEAFHPYVDHELKSAVRPPELGAEPLFYGTLSYGPCNIASLVDYLKNDRTILLGIEITKDFYDVSETDFIVDDTKACCGRHALTVVGYGELRHRRVFLIRNSWGVDWGYRGHAWVYENYLAKYCRMMACVKGK